VSLSTDTHRRWQNTRRESGQAAIVLLAFFSVLLLTAAGLAVDVSNLWFHRQSAQAAADAACQAGALDLLDASAGGTPNSGFTPGTAGTCTSTSSASICKYAAFNGFNSAGPISPSAADTSAWNSVSYSFPSSVAGITAPPSSMTSTPYLQVTVTESVETFLIQLVHGFHYSQVKATSICGLAEVMEPAPVLVLDPTASGAFSYSGGASLNIIGGPSRALQVDSNSSSAIVCAPSGVINTSQGGPNYTGSDVGITGDEPLNTNGCQKSGGYMGFNPGTTGSWNPNVLPVGDPYAGVAAPASVMSITPATYTATKNSDYAAGTYYRWVGYHVDGCPDPNHPAYDNGIPTNCAEFAPGYYPNGITLPNDYSTVIFLPGIYYINGSLNVTNNDIRMGLPCWSSYTSGYSASACSPVSSAEGWNYSQGQGVMFYFASGTYTASGGSGDSGLDTVPATMLTCDGSSPPSELNMPSSLNDDDLLWAPCTQNGTYYDSGGDTTDSAGNPGVRGILIFQAHDDTASPNFSGSAGLSFAGSLYFHSSSYGDILQLTGGTSTGTFIVGDIVTDQISLSGSGAINLALPSTPSIPTLKVATFQ
jgi:hypothetical protein